MKVSVIIPCYNQSKFLTDACNSIKNQTHSNWECLIVNDGSTDKTEETAKSICKLDSRFKYLYKKNGGLSSARNHGLNNATGDYIQFLDADDLITPEKFELSLSTNTDLVITNFAMLEKGKQTLAYCDLSKQEFSFESVLTNWDIEYTIPIHCGFFSIKIIENLRFQEDLKAKEDWLFWLNYLTRKPTIQFINKTLALYRQHDNNMCKNISQMFENSKAVYNIIHKSFDKKIAEVFFERVNQELTHEKYKYNFIEEKLKKEKRKKKITMGFAILFLIYSIITSITLFNA